MSYRALITQWDDVRKMLANGLMSCLPDSFQSLEDIDVNQWFIDIENSFDESLLREIERNCSGVSGGAAWSIFNCSRSYIEENLRGLDTENIGKDKCRGAIFNTFKQSLEHGMRDFLIEDGVDKRFIDNAANWRRIYPLLREVQQELEGKPIVVTDKKFISLLKQKIIFKGLHVVTNEDRLLDIIFDFYHEPASVEVDSLPIADERVEIEGINGVEMQLLRLDGCIEMLKAYSDETYQILHQFFIEGRSASSIYVKAGMSNTKFKSRKGTGLELLRECLEGHGIDALSEYEDNN
ncbi:hypothetical protein LRP52_46555 [Photobacterium sp. ZSDE20]|uniref:Uncharacterized protein n=1 Tax=Photobacterium pectinilyticum TaxID=2906793 RepID=A0ABT1N8Y5_9GAMM|nr:hypothetical protein [Photobacterium sp. ZSDE20]MCQ1061218.1 hypothetical protein [Photobacterium sp. ZSDE20]MDD1829617.1 hypothetical protein [Photobacterium sp. ZSDE20]